MNYRLLVFVSFFLFQHATCQSHKKSQGEEKSVQAANEVSESTIVKIPERIENISLTNEEWSNKLSSDVFYIMRQKGTERAFTGAYWDNHVNGVYLCNACGLPLFNSSDKFDSGTGWPSFTQPLRKNLLQEIPDKSHGMIRVEVVCARCKGHLGHVFEDGPEPTGLRYCMNSGSLQFIKGARAE